MTALKRRRPLTARQQFLHGLRRDIAMHTRRAEWLSSPSPTWADGIPVNHHHRTHLLEQSKAIIASARQSLATA